MANMCWKESNDKGLRLHCIFNHDYRLQKLIKKVYLGNNDYYYKFFDFHDYYTF